MPAPAAHEPAFVVSQLSADTSDYEKAVVDQSNAKLHSSPASRSTSTGGSSDSPLPSLSEAEVGSCGGLPDYEYPVPYFVRNTFIEASVPRPISLDDFFEERRIHSCPVETPYGFCSETDGAVGITGPQPFVPGLPMMDSAWAATASAYAAAAAAARCWMPPVMSSGTALPTSPGAQAPILRLADAIGQPELGSPEMPTLGSAGHYLGSCKPCAFFYTKGCGNATECPFCHLCPAGEKKRRQKVKGTVTREMQRMGLTGL